MPIVEQDVFIPRRPEDVFDYLDKAENLPVWDSSIMEAEQISDGPNDVGSRWRGGSKILGRRFEWVVEIFEREPPRRTASRVVEGKLQFTVTNTLEPEGDGTRFTYRVEAAPGLADVFGRLADPLVEKAQRRTVRANLDTLAELLS